METLILKIHKKIWKENSEKNYFNLSHIDNVEKKQEIKLKFEESYLGLKNLFIKRTWKRDFYSTRFNYNNFILFFFGVINFPVLVFKFYWNFHFNKSGHIFLYSILSV